MPDSREIVFQWLHVETAEDSEPCLTEHCIHMANNILEAMDTAVDPCEDFYSYACNGWIKSNPIPEGKSTWGTFMKLEQQNQLIVKHVLGTAWPALAQARALLALFSR